MRSSLYKAKEATPPVHTTLRTRSRTPKWLMKRVNLLLASSKEHGETGQSLETWSHDKRYIVWGVPQLRCRFIYKMMF